MPDVLGYDYKDKEFPYILLEYIAGDRIRQVNELTPDQADTFLTSLADFCIDLRETTFPSLGCLEPHPEPLSGVPARVCNKLNMFLVNSLRAGGMDWHAALQVFEDEAGPNVSATGFLSLLVSAIGDAWDDGAYPWQPADDDKTDNQIQFLVRFYAEFLEAMTGCFVIELDDSSSDSSDSFYGHGPNLTPAWETGPFVLSMGTMDIGTFVLDENKRIVAATT